MNPYISAPKNLLYFSLFATPYIHRHADPFLTNTVVLIYNHFSKHSPFFYMNMQNVQST